MQKSVALSSAEAEHYSASEMAIEIIFLLTLLANMQLRQSDYTPVFEDNTTCIEWANHVIWDVSVPSTLISSSTSHMRRSRTVIIIIIIIIIMLVY